MAAAGRPPALGHGLGLHTPLRSRVVILRAKTIYKVGANGIERFRSICRDAPARDIIAPFLIGFRAARPTHNIVYPPLRIIDGDANPLGLERGAREARLPSVGTIVTSFVGVTDVTPHRPVWDNRRIIPRF